MATQTEAQDVIRQAETRREALSRTPRDQGRINPNRLASGLGWFSLGLGLAEVVAPRAIARIIGTRKHNPQIRAYGLREVTAGVGILTTEPHAGWLWYRVAGDMLDLASLGSIMASRRRNRGKTLFSVASIAGVTALDLYCAAQLTKSGRSRSWARAEASLLVDRSPDDCYTFWRNLENLPRFMSHLESVRTNNDGVSHWVARGPGNARVEWDAEIASDTPGQRITWRSLDGSTVWHSGSVDFERAPGERGTIVRVQMDYGHSFRSLGPIAKAIGKDPEQVIRKELRRFKQVMETGEVLTTKGQPSGRSSSVTWLDQMAR